MNIRTAYFRCSAWSRFGPINEALLFSCTTGIIALRLHLETELSTQLHFMLYLPLNVLLMLIISSSALKVKSTTELASLVWWYVCTEFRFVADTNFIHFHILHSASDTSTNLKFNNCCLSLSFYSSSWKYCR